jgi:ribosomal protein S8
MGNDTIASMITTIRNANLRRTKVLQIGHECLLWISKAGGKHD